MTLGEFLSDRLLRIMIQLLCVTLAGLFLWATGTQPGVLVILLLALLLVFVAVQLSDFFRQRAGSGSWRLFWTAWTRNISLPSVSRSPKISMNGGSLT